jgi:ribose transport system ATP-binding protein
LTATALELHGISKHFGATRALIDADLTVAHGEVHALVGENGSGKSTLVKVLAGVYEPEPGGQIIVDGEDVSLPMAPGTFRDIGLSFVHQDLGLARPLTVLENLVGNGDRAESSRWRIRWRFETRRARQMLSAYGIDIDPRSIVNELPPVGQALVAIARAADQLKQYRARTGATSSVLILDEPTVFLPEHELVFLFDLIRSVVASGSSVIFISHDLAAVREVADRVTVLRDGRVAACERIGDVTDEALVELIVGPEVSKALLEDAAAPAASRHFDQSSAAGLHVAGLEGGRVRGLDLHVAPGEIVGLAGLLGSGAEDVPYLLFGARRATAGVVTVNGRTAPLARQHPAAAVAMGIGFIPADRQRDAIVPTVSVAENMMLLVVDRFARHGRVRNSQLRRAASERADEFNVRPRQTSVTAATLSGGNAQKVVLAKWLEIEPTVLLLHEPTQGVDVAARAQLYRQIAGAAEAGTSFVWVSSDFEELAAVCDRVVVVSGGSQSGALGRAELTPEAISTAVYAGVRRIAEEEALRGVG